MQIYLINLDRRKDRLSNMRLIFNELGVQFKRIAAIDGAKDVTKDFINANSIRMMETYSDPKGSRPLTLGMYIKDPI